MAIGWSGSSGGIGTYRELVKIDIEAGLQKYKKIYDIAPDEIKPLYKELVRGLEELHENLKKKGGLIEKAGCC